MSYWKPADYPSVSPYLVCGDAEALIAFVQSAFGGRLLRRFDRSDGSLKHAEVKIDDSVVMVGGGGAEVGLSHAHVHLYVPDCRAVYNRAVAAGAETIQEPQRKADDDDFRGGVRDPSGTTWWIASQ